jgi:membrane peptidoglycan carboxypeptidase
VAGRQKLQPTTALSLLSSILIAVGRPFYRIISSVFIAFVFLIYIVGHLFRKIVLLFSNLKFPSFKFKKRKIKIIYPQFRFHIKKRYSIPFILICLFTIGIWILFKDLPSPSELTTRQIDVSTKILDRNGVLLYTIYKDKNRTPVKLGDIPRNVRLATLAAEDAEFYSHVGFSIRGITRAVFKNLKEGKIEGGSTITQQLVKNALLSSEKTYIRKLRELILSWC